MIEHTPDRHATFGVCDNCKKDINRLDQLGYMGCENDEEECNPFVDLITLCASCYGSNIFSKERAGNAEDDNIHS